MANGISVFVRPQTFLFKFLTTLCRGIQEAAEAGVKLLSLPECFAFIGSKEGETLKIAEPLTGPIIKRYQALARHVPRLVVRRADQLISDL